jgi:hypothetical protein
MFQLEEERVRKEETDQLSLLTHMRGLDKTDVKISLASSRDKVGKRIVLEYELDLLMVQKT